MIKIARDLAIRLVTKPLYLNTQNTKFIDYKIGPSTNLFVNERK